MFSFFNDTATTEIYTYLHTLSLHDALPISLCAEALARSGIGALGLIDLDHIAESNINRQLHALTETLGQAKVRSEEHTSELQSLMRISYAVFCLKKKSKR